MLNSKACFKRAFQTAFPFKRAFQTAFPFKRLFLSNGFSQPWERYHEVRGEGEHKIMEHIRWARGSPDWDPNQTHCLYGLDADLIMLARSPRRIHATTITHALTRPDFFFTAF